MIDKFREAIEKQYGLVQHPHSSIEYNWSIPCQSCKATTLIYFQFKEFHCYNCGGNPFKTNRKQWEEIRALNKNVKCKHCKHHDKQMTHCGYCSISRLSAEYGMNDKNDCRFYQSKGWKFWVKEKGHQYDIPPIPNIVTETP